MRTTEAARYARWSLLAAASLAVIVAGVYGYRAWHAHQTKKQAPPPVPVAVERQSAEFSFSRIEKNQKIFTIRASRATEFKDNCFC